MTSSRATDAELLGTWGGAATLAPPDSPFDDDPFGPDPFEADPFEADPDADDLEVGVPDEGYDYLVARHRGGR
ncbi:MAG: hypothetical protein RL134_676 [Actinomycetota bacterium]